MTRSLRWTLLFGTLLLLVAVGCSKVDNPADLVVREGRVLTLSDTLPEAQAVAVRDGKIVFVGSNREASRMIGRETEVIDAGSGLVLPGLTDAHAHLIGLGRSLAELNLVGVGSVGEARERVIGELSQVEEGGWITGRGWDHNEWNYKVYPTAGDLEGTDSHPVWLRRVDGHAGWANRRAMEIAGISEDTPDPDGGRIVRDAEGAPTGVFIDNAMSLVSRHIPDPDLETLKEWARAAMAHLNAQGVVGMHDMGVDADALEVYRSLAGSGEMTVRVYGLLEGSQREYARSQMEQGPLGGPDEFLHIRGLKLYADGALGSRGAAMQQPYNDDPENRGLLVTRPQDLLEEVKNAHAHGFQPAIHAIGDRANHIVLNLYERVLKGDTTDARFRVEHAQIVDPRDIPRFGALGVLPSMQPIHATSDMGWAEERVGSDRIAGAYAWRSLIAEGARIPCGSDAPVEPADPLLGIHAAVTRQTLEGTPEGGWMPDQRMTVLEAIRGYTVHAAFAAFAEKVRGTIEVGKMADLTVLDRDITAIEPAEIPQARVLATVVGGEVVYRTGASL